MDIVHLHLLINHVPVLLTIFGVIVFLWGMYKKENVIIHLAMTGFIIAAVFSVIAIQSGEGAEDVIENMEGISESLIHDHEESAELANYAAILVGLIALATFVIEKYKPAIYSKTKIVVVALALIPSVLFSYTAYLGGQIRHSEIRDSGATSMIEFQHDLKTYSYTALNKV